MKLFSKENKAGLHYKGAMVEADMDEWLAGRQREKSGRVFSSIDTDGDNRLSLALFLRTVIPCPFFPFHIFNFWAH